MAYEWFAIPDGDDPLEQGDVLEQVELPIAEKDPDRDDGVLASLETYDVIVMSQSCDLAKPSFTRVALCPVFSLDQVAEEYPALRLAEEKERLRRGGYVGYHLLNQCEHVDHEHSFRVVDFREIYQASKGDLQVHAAAGNRTRLLPPYREHLAQAFARFFMRVGLPVDIPPFQ